jgi:hypothetical protein
MPDASCSLDIEITAYFATKSLDEFLDLQQVRMISRCYVCIYHVLVTISWFYCGAGG